MRKISWSIWLELGEEEVLLRLVGVSKVVWTVVGSMLGAWGTWLVGCDG